MGRRICLTECQLSVHQDRIEDLEALVREMWSAYVNGDEPRKETLDKLTPIIDPAARGEKG